MTRGPRPAPPPVAATHVWKAPGAVSAALARGWLVAAAGTVALQVAYPLTTSGGRERTLVTVAIVCSFYLSMTVHAAATRSGRAALLIGVAVPSFALLIEAVGVHTGVPFGSYRYGDTLGFTLLGVPLVVPLAWAMMTYPTVLAVRLVAPSSAWGRIAVGAVGLAGWDLFLDPMMTADGRWSWQYPTPGLPGVAGVPLTNLFGWLLASAVLVAGVDAVLPGLRAARPPPVGVGRPANVALRCWNRSDRVPVFLWLWVYASSMLANAAFLGRSTVALAGGAVMGVLAIPLLAVLLLAGRERGSRPLPGTGTGPVSPAERKHVAQGAG
jgi:uncharacterized membrane protein